MDSGANTATSSAANHLIEGLLEAGIEYVFSNMGTDHAPIIEALAGRKRRGQPVPKIITCPHENTAAHMAGGYAVAARACWCTSMSAPPTPRTRCTTCFAAACRCC